LVLESGVSVSPACPALPLGSLVAPSPAGWSGRRVAVRSRRRAARSRGPARASGPVGADMSAGWSGRSWPGRRSAASGWSRWSPWRGTRGEHPGGAGEVVGDRGQHGPSSGFVASLGALSVSCRRCTSTRTRTPALPLSPRLGRPACPRERAGGHLGPESLHSNGYRRPSCLRHSSSTARLLMVVCGGTYALSRRPPSLCRQHCSAQLSEHRT
jgi:hypothetical protein